MASTKYKQSVVPSGFKVDTQILITYNGTVLMNYDDVEIDATGGTVFTNYVTKGNNIPGWKLRILLGQDATTLLEGSEYAVSAKLGSIGNIQTYDGPDPYYNSIATRVMSQVFPFEMDPTGLADPQLLDITEANNQALARFTNKYNAVSRKMQGGVALGEIGKTLAMIRNPAKLFRGGLSRYQKDLKRGLSRKKSTRRKYAADLWLEYSYGWKPLLHDIDDAAQALAALHEVRHTHTRITGVGSSEDAGAESYLVEYANVGIAGYISVGSFRKVIYRAAVRTEPVAPGLMNPRNFGFDLGSFVPTAWELLPYSFLIDYFTNIGDILSGWSSNFGSLSWVNRTTVREYFKEVASCSGYVLPSGDGFKDATIASVPVEGRTSRRAIFRNTYEGSLVPSFEFQIPGMGTKWINLAALLVSKRMSPYY